MKSKTVAEGIEKMEHERAESEQSQHEFVEGPSREEIRHRAYELHLERVAYTDGIRSIGSRRSRSC